MLTALRHPACARQQRRLLGPGQPLTDSALKTGNSNVLGVVKHGIVPCSLPCVAFHRRTTRAGSVYTRTIGILPMFAWRASARVREPGIHAQQLGGAALWRDEGELPGHRSEQLGRLGERGSPSSLTISTSRPASAGVRGVRPVQCRLAVFTRTIGVCHVAAAAGKTACRSSRF